MCEVEMEGFSPDARRFFEWLKSRGAAVGALLKYGFTFSRSTVHEEYLHEDIREVQDRIVRDSVSSGDCFKVVLSGVDDAWEFSLLYFMVEMIQRSHEINIFDFKRRGLL